MTNSYIDVGAPASVSKRLDTTRVQVDAVDVERERVNLTGASALEIAAVKNAEAASDAYGLVTRLVGMATLLGHVDGVETLLTTIAGHVDTLETLIGATNTSLSTIDGRVDGIEALLTTLNGLVDGLETLIGTTNTTLAAAIPAGDNNIGNVDIVTVPADPFGANADAAVAAGAAGSIQAKLRRLTTDLGTLLGYVDGIETLLAGGLPAALGANGGLKTEQLSRASTTTSGTLNALNAAVTYSTAQDRSVTFDLTSGLTGTVTFEATIDGSNWFSAPVRVYSVGYTTTLTNPTATRGVFLVTGVAGVRIRVSVYTSGSATGTLIATGRDAVVHLADLYGTGDSVPTGTGQGRGILAGFRKTDSTWAPFVGLGAPYVTVTGSDGSTDASVNFLASYLTAVNGIKGLVTAGTQLGYVGSNNFDARRFANVFKQVALSAATAETTVWTPTSGKKFRLMQAVLTASAQTVLTFKDNTAGTTILTVELAANVPFQLDLDNGILSAAANNVLTVTRATSAILNGTLIGMEE